MLNLSPNTTIRKPVQREYLYYSRPGAPYKGAKTISPNEKARFGMRDEVLVHKSLSDGAVRLYLLLDNLSTFKGESWASQRFMAANLGAITERVVRTRLSELVSAGYLRTVKGQRSCRYILGWVSDRKNSSAVEIETGRNLPPDRKKSSGEDAFIYLTESSIESSSVNCTKCEDTGRIGGFQGGICDCSEGEAIRRRLWEGKLRA